jgi:hypothetical protein
MYRLPEVLPAEQEQPTHKISPLCSFSEVFIMFLYPPSALLLARFLVLFDPFQLADKNLETLSLLDIIVRK